MGIHMGRTVMSREDVSRVLRVMRSQWTVDSYDILTHNCCHFCEALCQRLGVGGVPDWVKHLAGVGSSIINAGDSFCSIRLCPHDGVDRAEPVTFTTVLINRPSRQLDQAEPVSLATVFTQRN